ncbi:cyclin-like protein interacting with PHO85 [Basidiobolus ranarum]|uniref:Cyclin-like protein interacting with PHO85 n=1 Tax=Basidiobolus ranarum TaxID=34480 RepID=A0ABR2VQW9_9FUNG
MNDITKFPMENVIRLVARYLKAELKNNDMYSDPSVTLFHSSIIPDISIKSYIRRIQKFITFGNDSLVAILIYLDRAMKSASDFYVNSYTIHRLLITSITVANKFLSDVCYPNSRYAKVGGLSLHEMNSLELEFLFMINFDLNIHPKEFLEYTHRLLSYGTHDVSNGTSSTRARQRLTSMVTVPSHRATDTSSFYSIKRSHSVHNVSRLDGTSELDKLVSQVKETILARQPPSVTMKEPEILKSAKDKLRALLSNRKAPYNNNSRTSICSDKSENLSCRSKPTQSRPPSYHSSIMDNPISMVSVPI